jgi:hypothetical protein
MRGLDLNPHGLMRFDAPQTQVFSGSHEARPGEAAGLPQFHLPHGFAWGLGPLETFVPQWEG